MPKHAKEGPRKEVYLVKESGAMREAPVDDGAEAARAARGLVVQAAAPVAAGQVRGRVRAADVAHHLPNS